MERTPPQREQDVPIQQRCKPLQWRVKDPVERGAWRPGVGAAEAEEDEEFVDVVGEEHRVCSDGLGFCGVGGVLPVRLLLGILRGLLLFLCRLASEEEKECLRKLFATSNVQRC